MASSATNVAAKGRIRRTLADQFEDVVAGLAAVIVVFSVLWGVLTRYAFPQPAAWSYEIATIAFAWLVFFGAAGGVRHRLHSDIDVFVATFPPHWQQAVSVFNFWLLSAFFASLAVFFALHTVDAHRSVTIALNLPRSVIYGPLVLASVLMLVRHVQLWRDPTRFTHREANIT
jgi:TRAP-type C4-dicarboxylate transport system permease small subunit